MSVVTISISRKSQLILHRRKVFQYPQPSLQQEGISLAVKKVESQLYYYYNIYITAL